MVDWIAGIGPTSGLVPDSDHLFLEVLGGSLSIDLSRINSGMLQIHRMTLPLFFKRLLQLSPFIPERKSPECFLEAAFATSTRAALYK